MKNDPLWERLSRIRLLVLDADGVLTSGGLYYGPNGSEYKVFDVKDGLGIKLLQKAGVEVAIISIKQSLALKARARDLGIAHLIMGKENKRAEAKALRERLGFLKEEVMAVGDDLPDLGLFSEAGIKVAVPNGAVELKEAADLILTKEGGKGAVREVSEMILKAKGLWSRVVASMNLE
ncbi:MAG: KdsC family phosphatase [Desulfatiglandales bacterium]